MMHRAAAIAAAAMLLSGLAGCETTQQESARIGRELGRQSAVAGRVRLGGVNAAVHVERVVLLRAGGSSAVALELRNESGSAQVDVPVLISVGSYSNATVGLAPSLQSMALLGPRARGWWVDDQVGAVAAGARVSVRIGASRAVAAPLPTIAIGGVSASNSFPGAHVDATVSNRSTIAQAQLAAYAVILRGGSAVGAGRAIVASLPAGASAPVVIPIVGSIAGTVSLTVPASTQR
jgi:hypothetical protein